MAVVVLIYNSPTGGRYGTPIAPPHPLAALPLFHPQQAARATQGLTLAAFAPAWIWILGPSLTSRVTLSSLLNLPEALHSHP